NLKSCNLKSLTQRHCPEGAQSLELGNAQFKMAKIPKSDTTQDNFALSGLRSRGALIHRALPCVIDFALSGLRSRGALIHRA
ncbi:MAG: hypothetical protein WCR52_21365, partial [Bacteroidota bacterium]